MSVEGMNAVLKHSRSRGPARAVLLVLAWRANDDREAWPSVDRLADEAGVAPRTVQTALRRLEHELGEIAAVTAGTGGRGNATRYRLTVVDKGAAGASFGRAHEGRETAQARRERAQRERTKGAAGAPEPTETYDDEPTGEPTPERGVDTEKLASEVLSAFNAEAGTSYGDAYRAMIARRIAERPGLDLEAHRGVIGKNFAVPWWEGVPSPSVLYRDARMFERALNCDGVTPRRKMSQAEQVDRKIRRLRALGEGAGDRNDAADATVDEEDDQELPGPEGPA